LVCAKPENKVKKNLWKKNSSKEGSARGTKKNGRWEDRGPRKWPGGKKGARGQDGGEEKRDHERAVQESPSKKKQNKTTDRAK